MSALSFFIGKGGVGKTTLSAAHAVWNATRRPRAKVLLLSTDPAHSLADIFEVRLGSSPRRLRLQRGSLTLRTLGRVAEEQWTDDAPLKQRLLELQERLESGELTEEQYVQEEAEILRELREVQQRRRELAGEPPPEQT